MRGCHAEHLSGYLDEFMWRERYGKTAHLAWRNLIEHIAGLTVTLQTSFYLSRIPYIHLITFFWLIINFSNQSSISPFNHHSVNSINPQSVHFIITQSIQSILNVSILSSLCRFNHYLLILIQLGITISHERLGP